MNNVRPETEMNMNRSISKKNEQETFNTTGVRQKFATDYRARWRYLRYRAAPRTPNFNVDDVRVGDFCGHVADKTLQLQKQICANVEIGGAGLERVPDVTVRPMTQVFHLMPLWAVANFCPTSV